MRKVVAMACLFSVALTGCATHPVEVVPAGVDHEELAAAIARRGQAATLVPVRPAGPPLRPPPSILERVEENTRGVLLITAVGVGLGLGIVAWLVLEGLAAQADADTGYSTPPAPARHR